MFLSSFLHRFCPFPPDAFLTPAAPSSPLSSFSRLPSLCMALQPRLASSIPSLRPDPAALGSRPRPRSDRHAAVGGPGGPGAPRWPLRATSLRELFPESLHLSEAGGQKRQRPGASESAERAPGPGRERLSLSFFKGKTKAAPRLDAAEIGHHELPQTCVRGGAAGRRGAGAELSSAGRPERRCLQGGRCRVG